MDIEDLLGFGVLAGGFELLESVAALVAVLVVVGGLLAAAAFLGLGPLELLLIAAVVVAAAVAGGVAGAKLQRARNRDRSQRGVLGELLD